jgi:predicted O-methyltransferase YrrM
MLIEKIRIIRKYVLFYIEAKSKYAIHSPFIYSFYCNVLQPQKEKKSKRYLYIEKLRNRLFQINERQATDDIGAVSKTVSSRHSLSKKIRNISQTAKGGRTLSRLVEYSKSQTIIELGTGGGIGTLYMREGNPNATIYTIEGDNDIAATAKELFVNAQAENIHLLLGKFDDVLPEILQTISKVDLVFIDGDHTKTGTLKYFSMLLPYVHADTIILFHDIYWSDEMEEAWREIIDREEVSLSIDVFHFGIVWFSKRLQKEHYKLRI